MGYFFFLCSSKFCFSSFFLPSCPSPSFLLFPFPLFLFPFPSSILFSPPFKKFSPPFLFFLLPSPLLIIFFSAAFSPHFLPSPSSIVRRRPGSPLCALRLSQKGADCILLWHQIILFLKKEKGKWAQDVEGTLSRPFRCNWHALTLSAEPLQWSKVQVAFLSQTWNFANRESMFPLPMLLTVPSGPLTVVRILGCCFYFYLFDFFFFLKEQKTTTTTNKVNLWGQNSGKHSWEP